MAQGVPFARDYGGLLDNRSFGGVLVSKGKLKFDALVLNDSKIQQLKKPYPKFVRTYKGLGFLKRNTKKIVRILKQKISWHYDNK